MNQTVEQFSTTAKENLVVLQELTTKGHADAERLMELNLETTKNLMSELFEYAKAMLASKDPQSMAALQAGLVKPVGEIITAYTHELQKILAGAGTEFTKASQASMVDVQRGITSLMGNAINSAPSGEGFVLDSFNKVMEASQKMLATV